jgi:hypothetical protein
MNDDFKSVLRKDQQTIETLSTTLEMVNGEMTAISEYCLQTLRKCSLNAEPLIPKILKPISALNSKSYGDLQCDSLDQNFPPLMMTQRLCAFTEGLLQELESSFQTIAKLKAEICDLKQSSTVEYNFLGAFDEIKWKNTALVAEVEELRFVSVTLTQITVPLCRAAGRLLNAIHDVLNGSNCLCVHLQAPARASNVGLPGPAREADLQRGHDAKPLDRELRPQRGSRRAAVWRARVSTPTSRNAPIFFTRDEASGLKVFTTPSFANALCPPPPPGPPTITAASNRKMIRLLCKENPDRRSCSNP